MKDIQPAGRVSEIQEYYFSRKLREVARLNAEGRDIISLGIGGPDRMPSAEVIDTLCEEARKPGAHSYQPYVGIPELRRAMSRFYSRHYGVELNPDTEIQPLIGSKEGILHVSLAFLNPGDGVLVPNPGYPTYTSVSRLVGAEIFNYDLTEDGGWMPDFEALERLPLDRIKLMWINYPHMPTGTPASVGLFEKIVDFGRRHGIVIAHDNPYSFIRNAEAPISIMEAEGARDVALEMNSLSKGHSMAGWRVGVVVGKKEWIDSILTFKSNMDSGMFYPIQAAADTALALGDEWFKELNAIYYGREKQAYALLDALGCRYREHQAGLFVWAELPEDYEGDSFSFSDEVMEKCDVFLTPGGIFGSEGRRYIRITLCCPEELLKKATDNVVAKLHK